MPSKSATPEGPPQTRKSLLDVFHHALRPNLGAVDVALSIGSDAFGGAGAGGVLIGIRNESRHLADLEEAVVGVAAMTVGNENVAIGCDQRRGRRVEFVRTAARNAALAEGQQQLAVGAELEDLVALAVLAEPVRHPDVSFRVDGEAVRKQYEAGGETHHELAGFVELEDWIEA